jgi:hypothetical protein
LTEFGVSGRVHTTFPEQSGPMFTWDLGLMHNLDAHTAFGAGVFAHVSDEGGALGLRARYRRWLGGRTSFDVAPGVILVLDNSRIPAFSGLAAINFADNIALTSTFVVAKHTEYIPAGTDSQGFPLPYVPAERVRSSLFVGGKLGRVPGIAAAVGFPVAVIAYVIAVCSGGRCFD